jgi:mRNA interferase MazF
VRRGDIHIVDFGPTRGSEADKRRPAVVVSNDSSNASVTRLGRGLVTVVPLTSKIGRRYRFQVFLPAARTGLTRDSNAQAEQIRAVAIERVGERIGLVPYSLLARLDVAIRIHLDLG